MWKKLTVTATLLAAVLVLPAQAAEPITLDVTDDAWKTDGDVRVEEHLGRPALRMRIGSATRETRDAMGFRACDNLDAFFAGREPGDRVA